MCHDAAVEEQTYGSYRDLLEPGETLEPTVVSVLEQAEAQGWRPKLRRPGRGFRYWCSCQKQHNVWLDEKPINYERLQILSRKTCIRFD